MKNFCKVAVAGMGVVALTACNGLFDDIYDKPQEIAPAKGQIVMDATSWTNWYYVDLNRLHQLTVEGDEEALFKAQTEFEAYPYRWRPQASGWISPQRKAKARAQAPRQHRARSRDNICIGSTCSERA